jgi:hypothetical protein
MRSKDGVDLDEREIGPHVRRDGPPGKLPSEALERGTHDPPRVP